MQFSRETPRLKKAVALQTSSDRATSERPEAGFQRRANGSTKHYHRSQRTTTVKLCKTAGGMRDVMAEGGNGTVDLSVATLQATVEGVAAKLQNSRGRGTGNSSTREEPLRTTHDGKSKKEGKKFPLHLC